jgi:hypothetical protein
MRNICTAKAATADPRARKMWSLIEERRELDGLVEGVEGIDMHFSCYKTLVAITQKHHAMSGEE